MCPRVPTSLSNVLFIRIRVIGDENPPPRQNVGWSDLRPGRVRAPRRAGDVRRRSRPAAGNPDNSRARVPPASGGGPLQSSRRERALRVGLALGDRGCYQHWDSREWSAYSTPRLDAQRRYEMRAGASLHERPDRSAALRRHHRRHRTQVMLHPQARRAICQPVHDLKGQSVRRRQ